MAAAPTRPGLPNWGIQIGETFIPWVKVTREQVDRMIEGEAPAVELQEHL